MIRKIVAALALCLVCTSPALAAGKIGVVDILALRSQSLPGQEIAKQGQAMFGNERSQLEAQLTALNKKAEDFNKQAPALSEKARAEKAQEIQSAAADLDSKRTALTQRMASFDQVVTPQIQSMLRTACAAFAKKNNYDLILDRAAVLYTEDASDVTAGLVEELNKAWKAQGSKYNLAGVK